MSPASHTIRFLPSGRSVRTAPGESLLEAALRAGVYINASCGGAGVCGKCRIVVEEGTVAGGLSERLSDADRVAGVRQACRAKAL
ncbi:MAG: 2Fe-2S iron-sulfur cluster-binding protein, partial [Thermodesulfobacteriota bacterium]